MCIDTNIYIYIYFLTSNSKENIRIVQRLYIFVHIFYLFLIVTLKYFNVFNFELIVRIIL